MNRRIPETYEWRKESVSFIIKTATIIEEGDFMTITNPYILAAIGTGFTFLMTALGAATIFLIRKEMKQECSLPFSALRQV